MPKENTNPISRFLIGGIAGSTAKTVVAPLDRVKILIQGKKAGYFGLSPLRILIEVYKNEGVLGLFQGNMAQLVRVFPYSAIQFLTFTIYGDMFKKAGLVSAVGVEKFVSGSMAGMTACTITYPLDLIRSRIAFQDRPRNERFNIQNRNILPNLSFEAPNMEIKESKNHFLKVGKADHHHYRGILHAFYMIFKYENGLRGLYKGFSPTLIGMAPYAGTSFYTFGTLKNVLLHYCGSSMLVKPQTPKKHLTVYGNLICGSCAGLLAQTVSYPLDVVRRVMQLSINKGTHHRLDGRRRTWYSVMRKLTSKYGVKRGLFRGLTINYIRVVPVVSVSFTVYETLIVKV